MKKAHHHGALKQALIEAALDLLDAEGVEAVSIRAVARKAGVSHAAPVNHFPDRRALLTGLAIHCFEELKHAIQSTGIREMPDARSQLIAFVDEFHNYGLNKPNRYRLMWRSDMLDASDEELNAMTDHLFGMVTKMITQFGDPPNISIMSRVVAMCSIIHGYVLLRIDGNFIGLTDEKTGHPRHIALIEALLP
ncbi:TetR/AcrR family transcriptional regulator [uncultured Sphingorhabdus sp.]|uniref:TetR/AcrR family transcriptional regulator n=1 Tax=uncultured Sphingorhabdus sp. TaxID=1686106 RepID=UPI00261B5B02|nr:TetR/AcrR family transcriptional regulator [uncultured Sphingorhabdus sp.]HMS21136.1 TetR/AcrR family transcriptional regulator [Sphingorhabdus sp.]